MAKIRIEYEVTLVEFIDWPDNEMGAFNYASLHSNLDINRSSECEIGHIVSIEKDGEEFDF